MGVRRGDERGSVRRRSSAGARPTPVRVARTATRVAVASLVAVAAGCEGGGAGPSAALQVRVTPGAVLLTAPGEARLLRAEVRDGDGATVADRPVTWSSSDPGVATVGADGRATAVGAGRTTVTAEVGTERGSAAVEVFLAAQPDAYRVGDRYEGREGYVHYLPGDLPLVLGAPHGGTLRPDEIPERSYGVVLRDRSTAELALAVRDALLRRTGRSPHLVVSRLHRDRLDPNREVQEAAQGNDFAEQAWEEYHAYLGIASEAAVERNGAGLFLDVHGHGKEVARVELGYLLTSAQLAVDDATLDGAAYRDASSVRELAIRVDRPFSEVIRGPWSLGGGLEEFGYPVVPAPGTPHPGDAPYFTGGYSTRRHGSRDGGAVSAIQLEHHWEGIRDTEENRRRYADALASILERLLREAYGVDLPLPPA